MYQSFRAVSFVTASQTGCRKCRVTKSQFTTTKSNFIYQHFFPLHMNNQRLLNTSRPNVWSVIKSLNNVEPLYYSNHQGLVPGVLFSGGVGRLTVQFRSWVASRSPPISVSDPKNQLRCHGYKVFMDWYGTFLKAIAVACRDVDVRNVKAIIIGPPDTPYEFGFFEVCISICDHRRIF
jgi:hypothetical protein